MLIAGSEQPIRLYRMPATKCRQAGAVARPSRGGAMMAWKNPTLIEICVGLEINGYLPAEF
jgi:coenzyme PQQ precursor peptide PqqA